MVLRIDMEKAYDRIEWSFLFEVLKCFGFSEGWIQLIWQCVSTMTYSLLLNESTFNLFSPQRDLCQGDPISPFLFIIYSEVLPQLLLHA